MVLTYKNYFNPHNQSVHIPKSTSLYRLVPFSICYLLISFVIQGQGSVHAWYWPFFCFVGLCFRGVRSSGIYCFPFLSWYPAVHSTLQWIAWLYLFQKLLFLKIWEYMTNIYEEVAYKRRNRASFEWSDKH